MQYMKKIFCVEFQRVPLKMLVWFDNIILIYGPDLEIIINAAQDLITAMGITKLERKNVIMRQTVSQLAGKSEVLMTDFIKDTVVLII